MLAQVSQRDQQPEDPRVVCSVLPFPRARWWHRKREILTVQWTAGGQRRTESRRVPVGLGGRIGENIVAAAANGHEPSIDAAIQDLTAW